MTLNYTTITELPDSRVLPLQLERSYSRYRFAASYCDGKDVCELACGGGQGLGLLAHRARTVAGGDCEERNIAIARATYRQRPNIALQHLDAHQLPFASERFDVVILYEAIYYFEHPAKVLAECRRILRPGGLLLICTANKDWPDFNPSPFSHTYFSVPELNMLCQSLGFSAEFYGGFPDIPDSLHAGIRSAIKRMAVRLHLMPKTMRGKALLKRCFFGKLVPMPHELTEGIARYRPPQPIVAHAMDTVHTAIYVVARRSPSAPCTAP